MMELELVKYQNWWRTRWWSSSSFFAPLLHHVEWITGLEGTQTHESLIEMTKGGRARMTWWSSITGIYISFSFLPFLARRRENGCKKMKLIEKVDEGIVDKSFLTDEGSRREIKDRNTTLASDANSRNRGLERDTGERKLSSEWMEQEIEHEMFTLTRRGRREGKEQLTDPENERDDSSCGASQWFFRRERKEEKNEEPGRDEF